MDDNLLMVYRFAGAEQAMAAEHALHALDKQLDSVKFGNIAVVSRTITGQVSHRETRDVPYRKHIVGSLPLLGMVGGLIARRAGALKVGATPAALIGGAVGLVGAVALNTADLGFSDDALQSFGEDLEPDSSVLLAWVGPHEVGLVEPVLSAAGGRSIQDTLGEGLRLALSGSIMKNGRQHGLGA